MRFFIFFFFTWVLGFQFNAIIYFYLFIFSKSISMLSNVIRLVILKNMFWNGEVT